MKVYLTILRVTAAALVVPLFLEVGVQDFVLLVLVLSLAEILYLLLSKLVGRRLFANPVRCPTRKVVVVFLLDYFMLFVAIILAAEELSEAYPIVGGGVFAFALTSFLLRNVGQMSIGSMVLRIRRETKRPAGLVLLLIENLVSLLPLLVPMYFARFDALTPSTQLTTYILALFALTTLLNYLSVLFSDERVTFFEGNASAYWQAPHC